MLDMTLDYDPTAKRFDLVFDGVDIALDSSARTPLVICLGTDRRAHTDDVVLDASSNPMMPKSLLERGGWSGDALDLLGRLIGSRLWLLRNAKQTEETRLAAESMVAEAVQPLQGVWGPISIKVRWERRGVLRIEVTVASQMVAFTQAVAA